MFEMPAPAPQPRSIASLDSVLSLLGRIIAAMVVVLGGMIGWFGADHLALARPANELPELGAGLPTERLDAAEPWRRFELSYTQGDRQTNFRFDFDAWTIKTLVSGPDGVEEAEIAGDVGYRRTGGIGEWTATSEDDTRNMARFLMTGVGPFLLTDLVPPEALGFTTLELEGTSLGERVYEVAVDVETLRTLHPLAHQRWVDTTRVVGESSGAFRVRVRDDGHVIRIEGEAATVTWSELDGPIVFESPLGAPPALPVTPVDPTVSEPAPVGTPVEPAPADPASVEPAPAESTPGG